MTQKFLIFFILCKDNLWEFRSGGIIGVEELRSGGVKGPYLTTGHKNPGGVTR
jgi:hypothetical protein